MTVHTESIHFNADQKLLMFIEEKLQKLEQFFDRIQAADVILKLESHGSVRDKIAEIKLIVPGGIIFIKEQSKTFEAAIEKAINSLRRQVMKYKERRQL